MNDIASGPPRLVEKIVVRGSWFVARKSLPLYQNRLWLNLTAGRLNQAGPYAQGQWPCIFAVHRTAAACHLRSANGVYVMSLSRRNAASVGGRPKAILIHPIQDSYPDG